jgi:hypothetical protein
MLVLTDTAKTVLSLLSQRYRTVFRYYRLAARFPWVPGKDVLE